MSAINYAGESRRTRFQQAADWLVRLQDPDLPYREYLCWQEWRNAPENQQAFDEVQALWRKIKPVTRSIAACGADLAPEQDGASASLHDASEARVGGGHATVTDATVVCEVANTRPFGKNWPVWKLAACLAGLAVTAVLAWAVLTGQTIETAAGEWTRRERLADGTQVQVGPNTRLEIKFSDEQRLVDLARGEAHFNVTEDPARPFVVDTDLGQVRAVGTAFGVTRHDDRVIVTVAEGTVAVSSRPTTRGARKEEEIAAGEQATLSRSGSIDSRRVDADRELAWVSGWCEFNGETVGDAVRAFNRRNIVQIQIDDEAVAERIRAYFRVRCDEPESFAGLLEGVMDAQLVRQGSTLRLKAERDRRSVGQPPASLER